MGLIEVFERQCITVLRGITWLCRGEQRDRSLFIGGFSAAGDH